LKFGIAKKVPTFPRRVDRRTTDVSQVEVGQFSINTLSQHFSVSNIVNLHVITTDDVILHQQFALFSYTPGPSSMVPLVPVIGEHGQDPPHVIVALSGTHRLQGPPSGPLYLPLHMHCVREVLPGAETELAGQPRQIELPASALKVPV